jgi:cell filamentation protein
VTFADPYCYPGTEVLRNKLDIRDPARLSVAEANVTVMALVKLGQRRIDGRYDLDHLRAFHRAIFENIYPWAGEIRTVSIAKSNLFALPEHIEPYLSGQLSRLRGENFLRNLERDIFTERLVYYFAEVNAVHPFREGNGRTQRAFFAQLAHDAGYRIHWDQLDSNRNNEASAASLNGDSSKLHLLMRGLIEAE